MIAIKNYSLICLLALTTGCASSQYKDPMDNVIVDTAGVDLNKYYADLAECKAFAEKVDVRDQTTRGVVGGVIVGSVVGAIIGNSDDAKKGGGAAGVLGGMEANAEARREQGKVMRNCLVGRGYNVLN
jgi:hypothetical protein